MKKPEITKECAKHVFESKFMNVFDLQYEEGKHYFDATRRDFDRLVAVKSDEDFKKMIPDAVSCFVIIERDGEEPRLLLAKEFRYPTGHFILGVPAGLIDRTDEENDAETAILNAAKREIQEETGIKIGEKDIVKVVNPLVFSSPGMTDESNALVLVVLHPDGKLNLTQDGAEGQECFNGFSILDKAKALELIKKGRDDQGVFYSVYTWMALVYFAMDMWK
ncbi:NUDIX hydrolase [Lachnospiraceae bacterium C1.1]|nr:NUDIX hydrolase [Lachnospiraceae bacterium C1.1]